MKARYFIASLVLFFLSVSTWAADYKLDISGAHASINFKVKHLGYSWLTGRFNQFSGDFSYDANKVADSKISVEIDVTSVDSNHAKRDKHLKANDFLAVSKFPKAKFVSYLVEDKGNGKLLIKGDLTLRGVTKKIIINAEKIGEGKDPWGGYRVGFSGTTKLTMADFGIPTNLGPASTDVYLDLHIEGIRK